MRPFIPPNYSPDNGDRLSRPLLWARGVTSVQPTPLPGRPPESSRVSGAGSTGRRRFLSFQQQIFFPLGILLTAKLGPMAFPHPNFLPKSLPIILK